MSLVSLHTTHRIQGAGSMVCEATDGTIAEIQRRQVGQQVKTILVGEVYSASVAR